MAYIDLYCERLEPGLLAEPLNAASNAAFLVAGWVVWRNLRRTGGGAPELPLLAGLMAAIGIGSGLFHTFAQTWAMAADLLPIFLFQLVFLWAYARRVMLWNALASSSLVAGFLAVALYARQFPEPLNGSLTYAPAVVALLVLALYHRVNAQEEKSVLLAAAGLFAVSLTFRTIDAAICPHFPAGTHFLWHLLNPAVLYLCARSLYAAGRARAMGARTGRLA